MLASGCLRAPIGDDYGDGSNGLGSGGASDEDGSSGIGWSDETGLDEGSGETTAGPEPACHPSYVPCLPIVDDLDCPDVVDLGAAPVMVVGPDDYGLDSDHDGVGCEP